MIGHHITEHARQKILKEIAIRAQKHVLDMTYNWYEQTFGPIHLVLTNICTRRQQVPILPEIRTHIESILARFKHTKSPSKPVLLPAKAITSPRETVEVQPFIVISPADIVTLVNTLFPERRPTSSHYDKSQQRTGLASSASSISAISMPFRNTSTPGGDASSILSASASSMTSDHTSREPLMSDISQQPADEQHEARIAPTESYGRRLRMACSEMTRLLGPDATSGSCHPCAEKWAVLYISPDGKQLKPRMRKDSDDEDEHDEDSPESDSSDDEGPPERIDLENDYHQLKEAITKLVVEYEIPKELTPDSESKTFSNRTSTHRRGARGRGPVRHHSENLGSRNPYNQTQPQSQSHLTNLIASQRNPPARHGSPQNRRSNSNPQAPERFENNSVLVTMLETAMHQCQARGAFLDSQLYYKTLLTLRRLNSPTLIKNGYAALLNYFSRGPRDSLGKSANAIEEFEAWFVWLKQSQERHDVAIEDMMLGLKNLRDKMWYITDVRNSGTYEEARNVALALKIMGQPTKTLDGKSIPTSRPRNFSKSSTNNFLMKAEAQVFDMMSAPAEFGGPNKLSDEQSEITAKWIAQYGVEIFCKGEERIHRFCLEIDKCVNKLVGDSMMDGPVLWASELFKRDKEVLDSGRQKGDLFLTGVGTLSIAGDEEYETHGRPARNLDFAQRPSQGSLRSLSGRPSQQSFDVSPWAMASNNSYDYFGGTSPVLAIDTATTFWSPFQTHAQSPTSATSIRPRTASSSKGTVMLKQSISVNEDKRKFLLDLKQVLTGLLLSDLGTVVFSSGSETDAWFSSDLLEDCLQHKYSEEEERRRRKQLARKKSMKSLRKQATSNNPLEALGRTERGAAAPPIATLQHAAPSDPHHSAGEHSSSSDATTRSSGSSAAKKAGLLDFPYNVAFRRLLKKFATHPNPFSKLHALYELELLIVASLSSRTGRAYNNRREAALPPVPQSPTLGAMPELSSREPTTTTNRANNLEGTIANCEERRSYSMTQDRASNASPLPRNGARSPVGPPSTDMIVNVIQELFRDANIRPKTLFRDLQYIASFVPAQMLDKTPRGKAFWDVALAALGLKQDVCQIMVEVADDIVRRENERRNVLTHKGGEVAAADGASNPLASRYTMDDVARMLLITAKEGDPTAERELATMYLTSPELLERTVLPLTKTGDIFNKQLLSQHRDTTRSDPLIMCIATHWMKESRDGGDDLAAQYLRQRTDLENIQQR